VIEFRLRTKVSEEELREKRGKVLTLEDFNVQLTRACRVRKPDGSLLAVYLPGAIPKDLRDAVWPDLSAIRAQTVNRGLASGTVKKKRRDYSQARSVSSTVVGAMDPYPRTPFCRLTSYTAKHVEAWVAIRPLFVHVAGLFAEHVPDRFRNQAEVAQGTQPEWVIDGTPFSTITVTKSRESCTAVRLAHGGRGGVA
jgi:hypothetical protein